MVELLSHFRSEKPARSSWGHSPSFNLFGIGPHEITEWTLVRDFHLSVDESGLINGFDLRGETGMDTKDLTFHYRTDSQVIEDFGAVLPRVSISILTNSFIVETIDGCDLSCLVVTSQ